MDPYGNYFGELNTKKGIFRAQLRTLKFGFEPNSLASPGKLEGISLYC